MIVSLFEGLETFLENLEWDFVLDVVPFDSCFYVVLLEILFSEFWAYIGVPFAQNYGYLSFLLGKITFPIWDIFRDSINCWVKEQKFNRMLIACE